MLHTFSYCMVVKNMHDNTRGQSHRKHHLVVLFIWISGGSRAEYVHHPDRGSPLHSAVFNEPMEVSLYILLLCCDLLSQCICHW